MQVINVHRFQSNSFLQKLEKKNKEPTKFHYQEAGKGK